MATDKELQDQLDEIRQKRADLSNRVVGLNIQHSTSNSHLLGPDFAAMDKVRFNSALKPLLMQDRILHQQEQQLLQAQGRTEREQRQAITAKNQADRAAAQAQKAEAAARKQAKDEINTQVTDALGLPKNKGVDYINNNGFYDPATGRIGVPDKPVRTAAQKAAKGDANAGKQVQAEISQIAKNAGVQGPVSPSSFFGENGFDMEPDKDGNYVYNVNGTDVTVPQATAERLQEKYNESLPPTQEEEAPQTNAGVKYIPVSTFQQANQALNQINGKAVVDPATRYITSQTMNRQAQPAIQAALAAKESGVMPDSLPSVIPAPDIQTKINPPSFAASLLKGHDPAWDMYVANQAAAKAQRIANSGEEVRQNAESEGRLGSIKDQRKWTAEALDAGAKTPQDVRAYITAKSNKVQGDEATLPSGPGTPFVEGIQNIAGNDISRLTQLATPHVETAFRAAQALNPSNMGYNLSKRGLEYLGEKTLPITAPIVAKVMSAGANLDDISKKYFAARGSNEIGPEVSLEDYAKRFVPNNATVDPETLMPNE